MTREHVGHIAVDAGLCWVGDPCYALPDDRSQTVGGDWSEFCNQMRGRDHRSFEGISGHEGVGVCVETGWGDGFYPVHITRSADGRIASVTVTFIGGDDT